MTKRNFMDDSTIDTRFYMDLGQVFTTEKVASYMVDLFDINKDAKIMDPCFGNGAFLRALYRTGYSNVTGYEIDSTLYKSVKNEFKQYSLVNTDFLGSINDEYDGIIMNPPYVRHEKINDLEKKGVSKKLLAENPIYDALPRTANLYMYFIVKGFSILKNGGEMIVIFPSSWMNTRSGKVFQENMLSCGKVERQIHISGKVFEKKALVEVVIFKFIKGALGTTATPEFIRLEDNRFVEKKICFLDHKVDFNNAFSNIAEVRRGLTTGYNAMYINPKISKSECYIRQIISSPKNIKGFSTSDAKMDNIFAPLQGEDNANSIKYVDKWKRKIIKNEKPQVLINKIDTEEDWFRLKLFNCKGIIFSYFVRNDMKFIMNEQDCIVRDNFYIIFPKIDKWLMFAFLNNYYIFYQLECMGKKYGAGLLKLQRYDIENLLFPNEKIITNDDKDTLKNLAQQLARKGDKCIIEEITRILSYYSVWSFDYIQTKYAEKIKSRLG